MKQQIITYLSTLKEELINLNKYLYDNPEESFKEYKSYSYIINLLKNHKFNVTENYLNIDTAFYAQYGSGHPKICYICEYDADSKRGHISGNNITSTLSIGAALGLSKILNKASGSVIVLGCPGEYINGTKTIMVKEKTFEDIDVVLMAKPYIKTMKNCCSSAVLPIKITYDIDENLSNPCISKDISILTSNFIDTINKNLPNKEYEIQNILTHGWCNNYMFHSKYENDYIICSPTIKNCKVILNIIESFTKFMSDTFNMNSDVSIYQLPYEEMSLNNSLYRIFFHNLKESGIIDIESFENKLPGLSLGSVSHVAPCIIPFIEITEDTSIQYPSEAFGKETIKPFALENIMKTIQALALTGFDLIDNSKLLKEIILEHKTY